MICKWSHQPKKTWRTDLHVAGGWTMQCIHCTSLIQSDVESNREWNEANAVDNLIKIVVYDVILHLIWCSQCSISYKVDAVAMNSSRNEHTPQIEHPIEVGLVFERAAPEACCACIPIMKFISPSLRPASSKMKTNAFA